MIWYGEDNKLDENKSANIRDMLIERQVRIKLNSMIPHMRARYERCATKRKWSKNDFRALLRSANENILSFIRIKRKAVEGEPWVYRVKRWR